jgi:hypothetical protein
MGWLQHSHDKSRLGQLLVKRKLITEEQLERAIERQRETGQRLGEILAEWNAITHQHMHDVLRTQRNLRLAGAIAAALLGPLRAAAAVPAPVVPVVAPMQQTQSENHGSMQVLTEADLEGISAQGLSDALVQDLRSGRNDGLKVMGDLARLVNPLLGMFDADVTMKDVVYDPANATATINKDGSITLRLPSSIGDLNFEHIRVRGDTNGPSFGSIFIHGIDLTGTTITLSALKH